MRIMSAFSLAICCCALAASATTSDSLSEIERDALALELFLQDRSDHKKFCPKIEWDQPKLEDYKQNPKSYLPAECKK